MTGTGLRKKSNAGESLALRQEALWQDSALREARARWRGAAWPLLLLLGLSGGWASAIVVKHHAATRAPAQARGRQKAASKGSGYSSLRTQGGRTGPSRRGSAARSHAGYGTGASTSYRATVNPLSRLDLIAGLATTLAHGTSAVRYPQALASFYAALAANTGQPASLPVRVLQFGDSHTAADMFTGEARRVFQGQFGNGGVGYSYAGHPFAGYRILGSSRSQSGGWTTLGTHFTDLGDAMTGLGGVAIQTYRPGEWVSEDAPCTSFEVQYLQQPGGGTLQVTDNGTVAGQIDTSGASSPGQSADSSAAYGAGAGQSSGQSPGQSAASSTSQGSSAGSWRYDCPSPAGFAYVPHHFVLTTESHAPVRLLGTVALQPGVTWESMGINGAEAPLMLRWNQTLFTSYLASSQASLVVLAYGTNEAAARWTYKSYSEVFARLIDKLHATLPGAALLVLGPTDRSLGASSGRGRRRHSYYAAYGGTARIVEAQRDVCRAHGCAFWDAQQRMGGFGSMQRWVLAGWAQPDHTHLTGEGYRTLADALLADLLSGYDAYREAHGLPTQPLRSTGGATDSTNPTADTVPGRQTPPQPLRLPATPPTQAPQQ